MRNIFRPAQQMWFGAELLDELDKGFGRDGRAGPIWRPDHGGWPVPGRRPISALGPHLAEDPLVATRHSFDGEQLAQRPAEALGVLPVFPREPALGVQGI